MPDVEYVKARFEEAGQTLLSLPMPQNAFPQQHRVFWPDIPTGFWDAFAANVGMDAALREEFAQAHNETRLQPSKYVIDRMEECLDWLFEIKDGKKRQIVFCRSLVRPISGRHIYSYHKLAGIVGVHKDTVRYWHDEGLRAVLKTLQKRSFAEMASQAVQFA